MMVRQSKIGSSLESKELVVFDILRDSKCTECGKELGKGDFLFMEGNHPVRLSCADFDHLIYLPRGDAALTRSLPCGRQFVLGGGARDATCRGRAEEMFRA
jgi:hypothetical protein